MKRVIKEREAFHREGRSSQQRNSLCGGCEPERAGQIQEKARSSITKYRVGLAVETEERCWKEGCTLSPLQMLGRCTAGHVRTEARASADGPSLRVAQRFSFPSWCRVRRGLGQHPGVVVHTGVVRGWRVCMRTKDPLTMLGGRLGLRN